MSLLLWWWRKWWWQMPLLLMMIIIITTTTITIITSRYSTLEIYKTFNSPCASRECSEILPSRPKRMEFLLYLLRSGSRKATGKQLAKEPTHSPRAGRCLSSTRFTVTATAANSYVTFYAAWMNSKFDTRIFYPQEYQVLTFSPVAWLYNSLIS